jgi:hypothetical protein
MLAKLWQKGFLGMEDYEKSMEENDKGGGIETEAAMF